MSVSRRILHPIESLRTAPFGFGCGLIGAFPIVYDIAQDINALMDSSARAGAVAIVAGAVAVGKQFSLGNRIDTSLEVYGHDDRFLRPIVTTWCDRQTAKVAYESAGYKNEFNSLVQEEKAKGALEFELVPHI